MNKENSPKGILILIIVIISIVWLPIAYKLYSKKENIEIPKLTSLIDKGAIEEKIDRIEKNQADYLNEYQNIDITDIEPTEILKTFTNEDQEDEKNTENPIPEEILEEN